MLEGMAGPITIRGSLAIPESELTWRFSRSGGPGGQSVNTADSRAELSWNLATTTALPAGLRDRALSRLAGRLAGGVLTVAASEHRSQLQNRRAAEERLASLVLAAIEPPPRARRATKPSRGSVERRIAAKKSRGETKRLRRTPPE
ncbi:MAG: ribosome-associated protein [Cryptosporangiaceae bacterium]|nr:ribosome-associated protein [Cryptosporangiaceae bacterium]